jgi:hypothetical protein
LHCGEEPCLPPCPGARRGRAPRAGRARRQRPSDVGHSPPGRPSRPPPGALGTVRRHRCDYSTRRVARRRQGAVPFLTAPRNRYVLRALSSAVNDQAVPFLVCRGGERRSQCRSLINPHSTIRPGRGGGVIRTPSWKRYRHQSPEALARSHLPR